MQNSDFRARITSLYGSQTTPVVLCMQNNVILIRITSLHVSQTSPVVLCLQTTWLASELLVSMDPSPHLRFLHAKQRLLDKNYKSPWVPALTCRFVRAKACKTVTSGPELQVSIGPRPHQWCFACKTASLGPELQVSMGPSPHLWFLHAKQRFLDQNYNSLWVPDFACWFVNAKQRA